MSVTQRALLVIVLAALCAAPASAQIVGHPLELSGGAGYFHYDARARMTDAPAYTGALGWRVSPFLTVEGQATFGPTTSDLAPGDVDQNFFYAGLDGRWNLRHADQPVVPFLLTGVGYGTNHCKDMSPAKLERGAGNIGLGALWSLRGSQRTFLRLEVRDYFFRERDADGFSNHLAATLGLTRAVGRQGARPGPGQACATGSTSARTRRSAPRWTGTAARWTATATRSSTASTSARTRRRAARWTRTAARPTPTATACATGWTSAPDTPEGRDGGREGLPERRRRRRGLRRARPVREHARRAATWTRQGCPTDADGDGVCDGVDQCPNTPAGLKVDEKGCPIEVVERETELMDTGRIRIQNINFDTGKATLKPESYPTLDAVGHGALAVADSSRSRSRGHTDDVGGAAVNRKLSQARAQSVLDYLNGQVPGDRRHAVHGEGLRRGQADGARTPATRTGRRTAGSSSRC